jgi:hypothetical protein
LPIKERHRAQGDFGFGIADCGFKSKETEGGIADLPIKERHRAVGDFGFGIADCGFKSKETEGGIADLPCGISPLANPP